MRRGDHSPAGVLRSPPASFLDEEESPAAHQKPVNKSGVELQRTTSASMPRLTGTFFRGTGVAMELEDREHWIEKRQSGCFWSSMFAFIGVCLGIALNEVRAVIDSSPKCAAA